MIYSKVTKGAYEFNSLALREDADGRISLWAYAPSGATAKTPCMINFSMVTPFGYAAFPYTQCTATGVYCYIGIPEKTLTSAQSGLFQIGGIASQVILATSITGSAYIGLLWSSASGLVSAAASASSSLIAETGVAGCFAYAQSAATTTHDIFLFGQHITNAG